MVGLMAIMIFSTIKLSMKTKSNGMGGFNSVPGLPISYKEGDFLE
jgi:hypothetical protein